MKGAKEMDEWDEGMEYLEEYDEAEAEAEAMEDAAAGAQGENDADINAALDVAAIDREARENGEKPADEWTRRDFYSLMNNHRELRTLELGELRALFLIPCDDLSGRIYYRRGKVWDIRRRRRRLETPEYGLAVSAATALGAKMGDAGALRRFNAEKTRLDAIWENL